jgi:hypothetical protein
MLQIRGVKVEAVAIYCEPLTTKAMGVIGLSASGGLSQGANNTVKKTFFLDITDS